MSGADVGGGEGKHHKLKKGRRPKRRMGVKIDMTPLVDVAFLLLTFFMLTTIMRKQQTLEINLPPDSKTKIEIAQSNLLTIYVDENGKVFYATGTDKPKSIDFNTLTPFFDTQLKQNTKLVVLLKFDRKSKFHLMVDMIDKLNLAKLQRFSIAPMSDDDKKQLSKAS